MRASRQKRTHFEGILKKKYERNYLISSEWNTSYKRTHFEGSLHWGGLCISRGTWLRIRCNVPPGKIFVQKLSNWKQKLESQLSLGWKELWVICSCKSYFPLDNWRSLENCPQSWHSHGLCSGQQICRVFFWLPPSRPHLIIRSKKKITL